MTPLQAVRLSCLLTLGLSASCSVRQLAVNSLAEALGSSADAYARDDDPELIRAALPFGLKTTEALLLEAPENKDLLLAATSGFTQFSHAFVAADAERLAEDDYTASEVLRERALKLYLRARDYGLRALELESPGIGDELRRDPAAAVERIGADDIDFAYWTGAAWGSAIGAGSDRPELLADVSSARALLQRVLELDEEYSDGAIHEASITLAGLPEMMGGSPERARHHFERAVELTGGLSAGPFVSFATKVSLPAQNRAEFEHNLHLALAIDPDAAPERRLANTLAQQRAQWLLDAADDLFLDPLD